MKLLTMTNWNYFENILISFSSLNRNCIFTSVSCDVGKPPTSALRLKNARDNIGTCLCYKMLFCNQFSAMLRSFHPRKHLCYSITVFYVLLAIIAFFNNHSVPMETDHRVKRGWCICLFIFSTKADLKNLQLIQLQIT